MLTYHKQIDKRTTMKYQNRSAALGRPAMKLLGGGASHGGESRDLNDKVHGISCRYSDKTSKQIYHTFLNTQPIFIKQSAHTS